MIHKAGKDKSTSVWLNGLIYKIKILLPQNTINIEAKRTQLKLKTRSLHWLINASSPLKFDCKILLYNAVLKPIWKDGSELWENACVSNLEVI